MFLVKKILIADKKNIVKPESTEGKDKNSKLTILLKGYSEPICAGYIRKLFKGEFELDDFMTLSESKFTTPVSMILELKNISKAGPIHQKLINIVSNATNIVGLTNEQPPFKIKNIAIKHKIIVAMSEK